MSLLLYSPGEVALEIADRVRARRLSRGWTQTELAKRAGIAFATLRKFEQTGQISLERLLLIAAALNELPVFRKLFEPPPAASLDELEARLKTASRKHGKSARRPRSLPTTAATSPRTTKGSASKAPRRGGRDAT